LVFLSLKTLKLFSFERTWWRLFQKHVVHTKFDIYIFIHTCTPKLFTQNTLYIEYSVLIGCFLSMSIKISLNFYDSKARFCLKGKQVPSKKTLYQWKNPPKKRRYHMNPSWKPRWTIKVGRGVWNVHMNPSWKLRTIKVRRGYSRCSYEPFLKTKKTIKVKNMVELLLLKLRFRLNYDY